MKAALYTRVSTLEQAQEGYSLDAQLEKLKNYVNYQNYDIYDTYIDDGYSASSLNRPNIQRLINDIKTYKINIVLVYKLDRLSRKTKDILELLDLFEKYNVTLFSLTENLDLSSPFGRAALKISATFSELERENIIERTTLGKDQRGKSGYLMANRNNPYGYTYNKDTKHFDINEKQVEIIKDIFSKYIDGYTFRKLYDYCKITYPDETYFNNAMCCKAIIHRPMYAGYYAYKGELIKGKNFEPIISMETYLKAQQCLIEHTTKRNNINTPYLLTGLVYCAKCGNRFVGKRRKHYVIENGKKVLKYEYCSYGCTARLKFDKYNHTEKCTNKIYDKEYLNNYVINIIKTIHVTEICNNNLKSNLIDNLYLENEDLQNKKNKLLDLYLDGIITKDNYIKRTGDIDKIINKNKKILDTEKNNINPIPDNISIDYLNDKIKNFDTLDYISQHKLISIIIDKILIDEDNIIINLRVK